MAKKSVGPWWYEAKNAYYVWHEGRKISLKTADETEAVKAWHRLMGGATAEAQPKPLEAPQKPEVKPTVITVGELITAFLSEAEKRISPAAYYGYVKFLKPLALAYRSREANALTADDVERFLAKRTTWGATYKASFHGTASSLFKWAIGEGLLLKNVMAKVVKPRKKSRGSEAVLTEAEHLSLLSHADPVMKDLLIVLWATGARPSEVACLTAEMIRQSRDGVIVLEQHKTAHKGKQRHLILSGEALAIVQRRAGDGLIFRGKKGQLSATAIGLRMTKLCVKAGVRHLMPYGYRHTFATDALAAGVPDATVASLLGHADTSMIHKHYSHLSARTQVLKDAASKIR